MSRMTKERRADLEKLADEDPHMCLLRELLNEIDAQEAEVAALRRQVEELRVVVPELHAGIVEELWIEEGPRFAANPREAFEKGVKVTNTWFLRNLQRMEATKP
jgi:hypothetical protein